MNSTPTPSIIELTIDDFKIKCFLENHWNAYIKPIDLQINIDLLFNDTVTHFSKMEHFEEIPEIDQKIISRNIKAICKTWYEDFLERDGNYKFNNRKSNNNSY